jgi:hypothetical protein
MRFIGRLHSKHAPRSNDSKDPSEIAHHGICYYRNQMKRRCAKTH